MLPLGKLTYISESQYQSNHASGIGDLAVSAVIDDQEFLFLHELEQLLGEPIPMVLHLIHEDFGFVFLRHHRNTLRGHIV